MLPSELLQFAFEQWVTDMHLPAHLPAAPLQWRGHWIGRARSGRPQWKQRRRQQWQHDVCRKLFNHRPISIAAAQGTPPVQLRASQPANTNRAAASSRPSGMAFAAFALSPRAATGGPPASQQQGAAPPPLPPPPSNPWAADGDRDSWAAAIYEQLETSPLLATTLDARHPTVPVILHPSVPRGGEPPPVTPRHLGFLRVDLTGETPGPGRFFPLFPAGEGALWCRIWFPMPAWLQCPAGNTDAAAIQPATPLQPSLLPASTHSSALPASRLSPCRCFRGGGRGGYRQPGPLWLHRPLGQQRLHPPAHSTQLQQQRSGGDRWRQRQRQRWRRNRERQGRPCPYGA